MKPRKMAMRLPILVLAGCLAAAAHAAPDCGSNALVAAAEDMGPRHHPVGRPLPGAPEFRQPDGCIDGVWLFDADRDRRASAGEIRLYGPQRAIVCASCHGDSPDPKSEAAANVFMRQEVSTLCLVCHNL